MAVSLFGNETPVIGDATDNQRYTLGTEFVTAVSGTATHGRWHFPANAQPGGELASIGIYRVSDQQLLGQAAFTAPTLGQWNEVAFPAPIPLAAGTAYRVAVYTPGRYVATTSYPWPKTSGDLTAGVDNGWLSNANGGTLVFPATESGNNASFFPDLLFEPDADLPSALPAGFTAPVTIGQPVAGPTGPIAAGFAVGATFGSPAVGPTVAAPDTVPRTYVDALSAMREWINSRAGLVGKGRKLQLGAHLKKLGGGEPATFAYLEENFSLRSDDSPESPDMIAALSAQVYGGTREAATIAAVALAEEVSSYLVGIPAEVTGATLFASDDIQGPAWAPDGEKPRLLVNFTIRCRPS